MLKPTQDFILVLPLERQHSDTLAVITNEKHCRGTVIAVGPGKRDRKGRIKPLDAKPGDIIAFGNGSFDFYPRYVDPATNTLYRIVQEADVAFVEQPHDEQIAA